MQGQEPIGLRQVLDEFCPMHVHLDATGAIRHAGPTFARIIPDALGQQFTDLVHVQRPRRAAGIADLRRLAGVKLHMALRAPPRTGLKGVLLPLPDGGALVNLSFGISVTDAVRDFALTAADFAATDLAIEMLYLVEAKSAAMAASRHLNQRLQGAKIAAEEQAYTDALTGLANRRALDRLFSRLMLAETPFALMHLDLDYFKQVNDSAGHAAGDHVLRRVAKVLTGAIRQGDTALRIGGDEFMLLLPGLTRPDRIAEVARRIIVRLEDPVPWDGRLLRISGSAGSAMWHATAPLQSDRLIHAADLALYAAKRAGRGRHVLHRSALVIPGLGVHQGEWQGACSARPDSPAAATGIAMPGLASQDAAHEGAVMEGQAIKDEAMETPAIPGAVIRAAVMEDVAQHGATLRGATMDTATVLGTGCQGPATQAAE